MSDHGARDARLGALLSILVLAVNVWVVSAQLGFLHKAKQVKETDQWRYIQMARDPERKSALAREATYSWRVFVPSAARLLTRSGLSENLSFWIITNASLFGFLLVTWVYLRDLGFEFPYRDAGLFDATELHPRGTPVALAPDTAIARGNAPAFAFSHTGTLVRATGYLKGSRREPMHAVPVTAAGARRVLSAEAALYGRGLALSPDGRRLALSSAENTIWVIDTERGTRVKLPPAPIVAVMGLRWSLDGRSLLLSGPLERGGYGILRGNADGAGSFERLVEASGGEREAVGWDPASRALVWLEREIGVETKFIRQEPGARPSVLFVVEVVHRVHVGTPEGGRMPCGRQGRRGYNNLSPAVPEDSPNVPSGTPPPIVSPPW